MTKTSRSDVLPQIFNVFRNRGYEGASLADLSAATGLGRSSLYHHFPGGKDEMALAAVELGIEWINIEIDAVVRSRASLAKRAGRIADAIEKLYNGGQNLCLLGQLATASNNAVFGNRLRDAFEIWTSAFSDLAEEAGLEKNEARDRAEMALAHLQGALLLSAAFHDPKPFRRSLKALPQTLGINA